MSPIPPIDIKPITPIISDLATVGNVYIDMDVSESTEAFDMDVVESSESLSMDVSEEIDVTVVQGTDVSDTTAVEADVVQGKKFYKADGNAAFGTHVDIVPAPYKDVNFFDYDGTVLYSYSASEFASLTELPANPVRSGLTAEGWNWTLADAKAQVALSGFLDIVQTYKTSDGKTRLYICVSKGRRDVKLYWKQTVAYGVTIDFGDGSTGSYSGTGNKNVTHSYQQDGEYVITMNVTSGKMTLGNGGSSSPVVFGGNVGYKRILRKAEIGKDCDIGAYSFYEEQNLQSIVIPKSAGSSITDGIGYVFSTCRALRFIGIPNTSTGLGMYAFRSCSSLSRISLPKSIVSFGGVQVFYDCSSLQRMNVPRVSSIPSQAYDYNYGGTIFDVPNTVTSIAASAFAHCQGAAEYHFRSTTPPTLADSTVFTNIPSDCVIYVPSASVNDYKTASVWSDYASRIVGE